MRASRCVFSAPVHQRAVAAQDRSEKDRHHDQRSGANLRERYALGERHPPYDEHGRKLGCSGGRRPGRPHSGSGESSERSFNGSRNRSQAMSTTNSG